MSLLQRALTTRPTRFERHKSLRSHSHYQSIALDAASHTINKGEFTLTIEFLEGEHCFGHRCVDLGPLSSSFRNSYDIVWVTYVCSSTTAIGTHGHNPFQEQRATDETLAQMRRLSEEQEVSEIRQIPGFDDFLKAKPFDAIQQAASEGPVIVLNHSKYRCDALIVLARENDPCVYVPLDEHFYADSINLHEELIRIRPEHGVGSSAYDEVLRRVMKTLWERVVSKIIQKFLELGIVEASRIWWCPISVLSAFPFHAAGPYKSWDASIKYLLDDYVSSYTPTLTSLMNARSALQIGCSLLLARSFLRPRKKERL
ncbi:hypothetical protein ACEPAF_5886 [Sanghuangporus sanghuang]